MLPSEAAEARRLAEADRLAEAHRLAEARQIAEVEASRLAEADRLAGNLLDQEAEEEEILNNLRLILESKRTLFLTPKRVASWGFFLAGKMMDYLFGPYFQLPTVFKRFERYLQVCHAYYTTALIYNYNTARPYCFFRIPPGFTFTPLFNVHFNPPGFPPVIDPLYIAHRLHENTESIKEIAGILTAPFMNEPITDRSSDGSIDRSSDGSSDGSTDRSSDGSVARLLTGSMPSDTPSDQTFLPDTGMSSSRSSSRSSGSSTRDSAGMGGGSLSINPYIKKYTVTRKNIKINPSRRGTIRLKRMIKNKVTKNKTYKRKVNNQTHLTSTKPKNIKTMRRYRRVRKW